MDPDEAPASPETSTSSAAATGDVGSSPSDCQEQVLVNNLPTQDASFQHTSIAMNDIKY